MLHFDNALAHNTETVEKIWQVFDSEEWRIRLIVWI
jgi:hypothetical protein